MLFSQTLSLPTILLDPYWNALSSERMAELSPKLDGLTAPLENETRPVAGNLTNAGASLFVTAFRF